MPMSPAVNRPSPMATSCFMLTFWIVMPLTGAPLVASWAGVPAISAPWPGPQRRA
jgi:hypothetical protein